MMKKTLATVLAAGLMMTAALGMTTYADDLGDPVSLTVTLTAVSTDTHAQAMMALKEYVEEKSGGNMTVDVFTDAQLFAQEEETTAVAGGMRI
jgi:TRAP-type C4-dicarboxylate transport system substrate-binding protein